MIKQCSGHFKDRYDLFTQFHECQYTSCYFKTEIVKMPEIVIV